MMAPLRHRPQGVSAGTNSDAFWAELKLKLLL